jgi:hypothetical protein
MEPKGRRVAITGLGVLAPCGIGREAYWKGLLGPGITSSRSIEVQDWDPSPWYDSPKESRRADRMEQFAIAAATEAFEQAGDVGVDPARFGTIFGTGVGGLRTLEGQVVVRVEKGERRVSPFLVPMMMANAAGAAISMRWGLQGPAETVSDYYALLPGDLDAAWPLMTADYQENHAGGRDAYNAFWAAIESVEITEISAPAPDQVQATLIYRYRDGGVVQEVTAYRLVDEAGVLKIAASEVLSSS